ncbi:centrosomal protein 43 isoform X2 [Ornithorhynchus anatinus]|uniref:Centrosomal protein 43 n=1 Tax=Ornithorhynchus anatinus TaxID=9258 RepID=F7GC46_ORNAN|nr:centrosomal protein 43 isoform X2 [Ornithorhynchus anatinus]
MAAAAVMAAGSAAAPDEDTELRDLLVQTLENSGVLSRIKAELRAAVFLALEEQEKIENKAPLVNESLTKFLSTKDGRLAASLVAEFLQFFNLDFTLAVFQSEANTFHGLEARADLAQNLGVVEVEGTGGGPLLLEVIRRCQRKEKSAANGEGAPDPTDFHSPPKSPDGKTSPLTVPSKASETSQSDKSVSSSETKSKSSLHILANETKLGSSLKNLPLDAKDKSDICPDEDDVEGDSFFDDPIPKLEKTYGWASDKNNDAEDAGVEETCNVPDDKQKFPKRKSESNKHVGSLTSLSNAPPLKSGLNSLTGASFLKESENSRRNTVLKDLKVVSGKIGVPRLGLRTGEEDEYIDDFSSTSHRSEKSEISIDEEIEEEISVDIEDSDKLEDFTQDLTMSHLSDVADYLEDVA